MDHAEALIDTVELAIAAVTPNNEHICVVTVTIAVIEKPRTVHT